MASKQTYECYVCKKNGFSNTRVYLDGKTENGKTVYKNEDMTPHSHKLKQEQQQQAQQGSTTITTEPTQLKQINQKLDRILSLLEKEQVQGS